VNILNSGGGSDMLFGLGGNDVYLVGGSDDLVFEFVGGGWDTIFSTGNYTLQPGSEIEVLSTSRQQDSVPTELKGNEFGNQLWGNAGDNMLDGAGGDDALFGLGGDDTLIGDGGTDELWGGTGDDVYIVDDAGDEANDLAGEGTDIVYTSVSYVLGAEREIETLSTSSQQGTGAIDLTGNEFANTLWGNAGANVLDGGGGVDLLLGLGGADTFAFTTALGAGNVDFIGDMVSGLDEIALDDAVFTGLSTGALDPNAFRLGAAAQDADDRILYDATTGALYFDADGNGAGAAVQFASVQPATVIAAGDFTVI
jgi:Ca2+-binding RTX toxin-like protein